MSRSKDSIKFILGSSVKEYWRAKAEVHENNLKWSGCLVFVSKSKHYFLRLYSDLLVLAWEVRITSETEMYTDGDQQLEMKNKDSSFKILFDQYKDCKRMEHLIRTKVKTKDKKRIIIHSVVNSEISVNEEVKYDEIEYDEIASSTASTHESVDTQLEINEDYLVEAQNVYSNFPPPPVPVRDGNYWKLKEAIRLEPQTRPKSKPMTVEQMREFASRVAARTLTRPPTEEALDYDEAYGSICSSDMY